MKPRQTLEAARARLAAAEAAYNAAATPEVPAEIEAATADVHAADDASDMACDDMEATREAIEERLRLRVTHADFASSWHPDLLADFERATGVPYVNRRAIQPRNAGRDVYDEALRQYVRRVVDAESEYRAAADRYNAVHDLRGAARARRLRAVLPVHRLSLEVDSCRSEVAALEAEAKAQPSPEDAAAEKARRAEARKAEALAKHAREVLAKIAAGELDPRAEVSRGR